MALVYAAGDIVPGESQSSPFGGGLAGSDTIVRGLRQARQDDGVRAIVLRVDSPGGSGTASDAVWREVTLARKAKPVVVSMGDYAASGGYYIAMGADAIVAEPGTITGSIGVFSGKFSLRGLYGKLGISQETVRRGRNATLFSSSEPWTTEERAKVRAPERGLLRDVRHQGGRGAEEDAPGDRGGGPGTRVDGPRRRSPPASSTPSAGSTRPSRPRARERGFRRARRSSSSSCPRGRASWRRSSNARTRTCARARSGEPWGPRRPRSCAGRPPSATAGRSRACPSTSPSADLAHITPS